MSKVRQKIEELRSVSGTSIQNSIDEITTTIEDTIQPQLGTKVDKTTTVNTHSLSSDVVLTKSDIDLGNVDNTSDITKNVLSATKWTTARSISFTGDVTGSESVDGSTNVATALTLANSGVTVGTYTKTTVDAKGRVTSGTTLSASDIPSLDASKITSGTIDTARLPSYVDDVIEAANLAALPTTGETGKIYIALDTNKAYRWSGSTYVYITSGAVDSVAGKTGVVTLVKGDVGLGNVDNTSDANKPISTATQSALDIKANLSGATFTGAVALNGGITANTSVINIGSGQIYKDTSGNVGIGTSSPSAKLHTIANSYPAIFEDSSGRGLVVVKDSVLGTDATAGYRIYTHDGTAVNYHADFIAYNANQTVGGNGGNDVKLMQYRSGALVFGTNSLERMRIDSSGNVGIGTSSPATIGSGYTTLQIMSGATNKSGALRLSSSDSSQEIGAYFASNLAYFGTLTSHPLLFTTGNAERMRIDSSGNVGIGTSSPSSKLHSYSVASFVGTQGITSQSDLNTITLGAGSSTSSAYSTNYMNTDEAGILTSCNQRFSIYGSGNTFKWTSAGIERMRIDSSGNVGIGTSSPSALLAVNGAISVQKQQPTHSTSGAYIEWNKTFGDGATWLLNQKGGGAGGIIFGEVDTANSITERMRIDSSGNVGIGVTPSAWDSSFKALQINNNALFGTNANYFNVASNAYHDGSWKYKNSGNTATNYQQSGGGHYWLTAPSGTAGNAIPWTTAMSLESATAATLQVRNSSFGGGDSSGTTGIYLGDYATGVITLSREKQTFNTTSTNIYSEYGYNVQSKGLSLYNNYFIAYTNDTERMRIDSSGNVGIGTSSPVAKLDVRAGNTGAFTVDGITAYKSASLNATVESRAVAIASSGANNSNYIGSMDSGHPLKIFTYNSSSSTYNTVATFMNNGNLLVGTTTDNGVDKLQVNGSISIGTNDKHYPILIKTNAGASDTFTITLGAQSVVLLEIIAVGNYNIYKTEVVIGLRDWQIYNRVQYVTASNGVTHSTSGVTTTFTVPLPSGDALAQTKYIRYSSIGANTSAPTIYWN